MRCSRAGLSEALCVRYCLRTAVEVVDVLPGVHMTPPPSCPYLPHADDNRRCEGCAARLRAAVLQLPGVRRCVVDFASKAVLLWGEAGQLGEQGEAARAAIQHMDLSYRVALEESRRL